jgi:catechol 2,3-dioxygenase-like lactoylglutathione lyase family enzyme
MTRPTLVPELYVTRLESSLDFYLDVLGFELEYARKEEGFAAISLGAAHLMLEEAPSLERATATEFRRGEWRTGNLERPFGRGVNFEIEVASIDAANDRIADKGYSLLLEVHTKTYRLETAKRTVRRHVQTRPVAMRFALATSSAATPNGI